MDDYKKPWHVMPSKVIELGLQHSTKDTDFDRQVAFLLLDIGVEAALKVFLMTGKDDDVEYIRFPELIKRVKDSLESRNVQGIDLEQVKYFHGLRNKLYHQGDGVTPTQDNLKRYGELAKILLKVLFDIEINSITTQSRRFAFHIWGFKQIVAAKYNKKTRTLRCNNSLEKIQKILTALHSNSSILVEHLYPQIASRKLLAQIKDISNMFPEGEHFPLSTRTAFQESRIDLFNKITGWGLSEDDIEFIDYIIGHPERLHAWLALQEVSTDWSADEKKYFTLYNLNSTREEELDEVYKWSKEKASAVYDLVHKLIPDISTELPNIPLEW